MAQDSTVEFSRRLQTAVEGYPTAPPTPHGRQRWLLGKLEKEGKLQVSPNTMHKWMTGASKPREDNIRVLAKVLQVDEVWLALGKKPEGGRVRAKNEASGNAPTWHLAAVLENAGHRVSFPGPDEEGVNLWANIGGDRIGFIAVEAKEAGDQRTFIVPEPSEGRRIVAVSIRTVTGDLPTLCLDLLDLTEAPRENLGGFSIIRGEARKDGRIKVDGIRTLVSPITEPGNVAYA